MTVAVLAVPSAESISPPAAYRGLDVTWVGCDGSTWAISDWSSGVALLTEGVSGLHWPAFDFSTLQADSVDGQVTTGGRVLPRAVELRIGVKADSTDAWADLDARWWKSWDPLKTGTLTISSRRGSRSIRLRLEPDEIYQYAIDPNMAALAVYKVQAVADSPLWSGDPLRRTWSSIDNEPFLDPAGSPPFWITPANLVDTATMANPGDKPAWPVWTVTAAGDDVDLTITCDGGTIGLPTVPDGKTIRIDTSPITGGCDQGVLVDGVLTAVVDVDPLVTPWQPRRVPPGASVPIGLSMTGPGRVECTLTPLFYRGLP